MPGGKGQGVGAENLFPEEGVAYFLRSGRPEACYPQAADGRNSPDIRRFVGTFPGFCLFFVRGESSQNCHRVVTQLTWFVGIVGLQHAAHAAPRNAQKENGYGRAADSGYPGTIK